jgi:hypothetical protein
MKEFALAAAWNWEYDSDFMQLLKDECRSRRLSLCEITPENLPQRLEELREGKISFRSFFDRASDADEAFFPLVDLMNERAVFVINRHEDMAHARDKASMHLELITAGLNVPFTIIVSPFSRKQEFALSLSDLEHLGRPFIIKPANTTGGGLGVVLGAETLKEVLDTRQHHKDDKYLLQETIRPAMLDHMRAWFRVIYALGEVIPCWWDDQTHVYRELSSDEEQRYGLGELRRAAKKIHSVCRLDFFSTEIALTPAEKFVVIDYVNEVCDMRLQSKHTDGVPDDIVQRIAAGIAKKVAEVTRKKK